MGILMHMTCITKLKMMTNISMLYLIVNECKLINTFNSRGLVMNLILFLQQSDQDYSKIPNPSF